EDGIRGFHVTGVQTCALPILRRWEVEWFYQEGASRLFPEAWEQYEAEIPEPERDDFIAAYHRRLTSDDEATRLSAARAWSVWERSEERRVGQGARVGRAPDPW